MLLDRHQTHVALREVIFLELGDGAHHRYVAVAFNGGAQHLLMPRTSHSVQYYTLNGDLGIEMLTTQNRGSSSSGDHGSIHHQKHRRLQQFGQFGGTTGAFSVHTVEKATIALNNRALRLLSVLPERVEDLLPTHHIWIQIVAGPAGSQAQPARINIIWTLLKGNHLPYPLLPGSDQSKGKGGFS